MAEFEVGRRGVRQPLDGEFDLSFDGSDWDSARQEKFLEEYDDKMDKLMLESTNVAEVYRAYRTGNLRKILETVNKLRTYGGSRNSEIVASLFTSEGSVSGLLMSSDTKLEHILDRLNFSDPVRTVERDPEIARAAARARLAYCNDMVKLFRKMLQLNRDALGLSTQEANIITAGLDAGGEERKTSIKMAKVAIMKNKEKFKTNYGYDFTSLGGGRVYTYAGFTGLESHNPIETLIQYGMRYDATIVTHGSGVKKGTSDLVAKYKQKLEEINDNLRSSKDKANYLGYIGEVNSLIKYILNDKVLTDEMRNSLLIRIRNEISPITIKLVKKAANSSKNEKFNAKVAREFATYNAILRDLKRTGAMGNYKGENADWMLGTITTEWGQKYNDAVKLIKDLIAHGHKTINLLACNPGEVDLRKIPEIKNQPGVRIRFTPTTHLVETPTYNLIDAYHAEYLNEDLKGVWVSIKNFIKKAWEKIKAAFVKLGQTIVKGARALKEKIVKFASRIKNKKPEKKTRHISIDPTNGAVTDKETTDSGTELKKQVENIERTGKIMDQIKNQQDLAFKQYMTLIDVMIQRGNEKIEEAAYIEAAKIMETYCRLASASAAGENLVSDEIFDKKSKKKKKLQTIEGEA